MKLAFPTPTFKQNKCMEPSETETQ